MLNSDIAHLRVGSGVSLPSIRGCSSTSTTTTTTPSNPRNNQVSTHSTRLKYLVLLLLILVVDHCIGFQSVSIPSRPKSSEPSNILVSFRRTSGGLPNSRIPSHVLFAASKSGAKLMETHEDFTSNVLETNSNRPVMVFFTAPWCGPCRLSTPVVKDVMRLFANQMDTVEVCTDDLPEVAAVAGVVSIPTIQMYYRGQLLDTIVGCVAKSVLSSAVEKVMEDAAVQFGRNSDGTKSSGDQLREE